MRKFSVQPEVLFLTPRSIGEIEDNILDVGRAIGRLEEADALVRSNQERLARVRAAVKNAPADVLFSWSGPTRFSAAATGYRR